MTLSIVFFRVIHSYHFMCASNYLSSEASLCLFNKADKLLVRHVAFNETLSFSEHWHIMAIYNCWTGWMDWTGLEWWTGLGSSLEAGNPWIVPSRSPSP